MHQLQYVVPEDAGPSPGSFIAVGLVQKPIGDAYGTTPSDEARREFTRIYLTQIHQLTGGNVTYAANLAECNRTNFYRVLQRYLLIPGEFKGT